MISGFDVRKKYLDFFAARGHVVIPSAPLVPENDPTTLFTSSGMQPLVPNLLGQPHPSGTKLVDSQKCIRTQDIEEVGDNRHTTFFEMLGNWSLGAYFKEEQLTYFHEFLTKELGLPQDKLWVSVFAGNDSVPKDTESIAIWKKLGIHENRIKEYPAKKNWWSRSGEPEKMPAGEPGGPDSEVFFEFDSIEHDPKFGDHCHPNCDCGRFMEIGNSVFMQYQKQADGSLKELPQKNVDFGGGLERLTAAVNNDPDVFKTDLFWPIIEKIQEVTGQSYEGLHQSRMRIIADHLKAAAFLISDGVQPTNKAQGYVVRRLIRRAATKLHQLKNESGREVDLIVSLIQKIYKNVYFLDQKHPNDVEDAIFVETQNFATTLERGLKEIDTLSPFNLFQSYGFPPELTEELLSQRGKSLDWTEFNRQKEQHQDLSRTAGKGMFKGGLQDQSEITTRYHTATHLLHQALRDVLGSHVQQKGSNITSERLRFDFSHDSKLSDDQIQAVEDIVNKKITEDLPVTKTEMKKSEALSQGALAFFPEKYPEITNVYTIGDYSKELCGGPHVTRTSEIGKIKIVRQESAGAGIRRIYAN